MKQLFLFFSITCFLSPSVFSQDADSLANAMYVDSVEKSYTYQHGTILLKDGLGKIVVPAGFKFLEPVQAERVLVDLWHNPGGNDVSLGMLLPENQGVLDDAGYVFNIEYDELGYVKDDDADDINYDELLTEIQKEAEEANAGRIKEGYSSINIIGWASAPFYDKEKKILHWAKEIKFGDNEVNTLNYNVRVLGRKGVMVLNAIASMPDMALVKRDIPKVLNVFEFSDGNKYKDFDPGVDNVAAWTIGGLVAGKVLAKVGFFAIILKFWKIIAIAVAAFSSLVWKRIRGKKDDEPPVTPSTQVEELPEGTV